MTNCKESNTKNPDICSQYEKFCAENAMGEWGTWSTYIPSRKPSLSPPSLSMGGDGTVLVPIGSATPSLLMGTRDPMPNLPAQTPPSTSNAVPVKLTPKPVVPDWVALSNPTRRPTAAVDTPSASQPTPPVTSPTAPTLTILVTPPPSPSQNQNSTSALSSTNSTASSSSTVSSSSSTTPATPIVPAATQQIQQACSNITSGDTDARSECIGACQDVLCCFADELGYEWIESCYIGNEELCSDYSSCLALKEDGAESDATADGEDGSHWCDYVAALFYCT